MRRARRGRGVEQLPLLDPPRNLPPWGKLPKKSREAVVRLLAKMLREHAGRRVERGGEGGAGGE